MSRALPFAISFIMLPCFAAGAMFGGWYTTLPFLWSWVGIAVLDRLIGLDISNMDANTAERDLFWHRVITWAWIPAQLILILCGLYAISLPDHLSGAEQLALMAGLGVATGTIGITYAHELIHQHSRAERALGEALLISVGYGHFATEHRFGHHITVATPQDPVSARPGQSLYAFLPRALFGSLISAWKIERQRLHRRGKPIWSISNPFWRYVPGYLAWLALAAAFAGSSGIALYMFMSLVAILQLEAVNYVEHYGLTRRYLGDGKFERPALHHAWNASHSISNRLLINLQRHSDHHARPDRRYPLLQHHSWRKAPQLPFDYAVMIFAAMIPPLWFWMMEPRLTRWRETFYPDITDWQPYDSGTFGQKEPMANINP